MLSEVFWNTSTSHGAINGKISPAIRTEEVHREVLRGFRRIVPSFRYQYESVSVDRKRGRGEQRGDLVVGLAVLRDSSGSGGGRQQRRRRGRL